MFVCLSVRMEKHGSHWKDFHEIWYFSIFRNSIKKIQVSLKSDHNNGYLIWRTLYIMIACHWILLGIRKDKFIEKIKTQILYWKIFSWKSCLLWDVEKCGRFEQANKVNEWKVNSLCMLGTYDYKHTLRIRNTYCFCTIKMVTRRRLYITFIRKLPLLHDFRLLPRSSENCAFLGYYAASFGTTYRHVVPKRR
jgi:hypothetical protein